MNRILKITCALVSLYWLVPSYAATDFATAQKLRASLSLSGSQQNEEIPVIITFDDLRDSVSQTTTFTSPFGRPHAFASAMSAARASVLSTMSQKDYKHVKQYEHVPQMAITVNQKALDKLLENTEVSIAQDALHRPFLTESVNRIFPNQATSPYDGNNEWVVAVLDTGVDKDHSFLSGKVVSEACYSDGGGQAGTTSFCPAGVTSSTATGSGVDCTASVAGCDHGTHVAGIAAGNGSTFDGVAERGKLISIQVFSRLDDVSFCFPSSSCAVAYSSDIIAGLDRVYDLRNSYKIAAANLSLGFGDFTGACDDQPEKVSIDLLKGVGIATVVASGNTGNPSQIASPACISTAIAVGSSLDTADTKSNFSSNSVMLDFYAPGEAINSSVPGGGFANFEGTSQAAPHVAGAWAVLKHASPGSSVDAIETLLDSFGPFISSDGVSRRRIDLTGALNSLSPGGSGGPGPQATINLTPILMLLLLGDE